MSDVTNTTEPSAEEAAGIVLGSDAASAFAALMDVLAPEESPEEDGASGDPTPPPAGGDGLAAAAPEGAGAAAAQPVAPAGGDPVVPPVAPGSDAGPAATGLDPVALAPAWGQLRDGLEKKQNEELTDAAVASIREDFGTYIEAIEKHPRLLIGAEVPRADGSEGMERIKDEADAKSWQDAIRGQLGNEVRSRVSRAADETRTVMTNIHAAIALFENNPDIIPKSKTFDKELADKFANMVEPYEFRVDGKLNGYTVPVQGFLTQLRKDLAAQRAAAATAATPPAPTAQQQRAAVQPRNDQQQFTTPPPGPQGGIQSKAGTSSDEGEDFSVLFGTLDPSLRDFRF